MEAIRALLRSSEHATGEQLLPSLVPPLIESVRDGSVFADAVWHPNGFVVSPLAQHHGGLLRLHIWPSTTRVRRGRHWPVHDHMWPFASLVLTGALTEVRYNVHDDPASPMELFAGIYGVGHASRLEPTGRRVRARADRRETYSAGTVYSLPAGQFHSTHVPHQTLTATLLLSAVRVLDHPRLVGVAGADPGGYERPLLTEGDRVRIRTQLLSALTGTTVQ